MKKGMGVFYLLLFLLLGGTGFAAPTISINPDLTELAVGAVFSIEVVIGGEDIENMSAWNGTLQFDPDVLAFHDADMGAFRCFDAVFQFNDPSSSDVIMVYYTLPTCALTGQGIIAVVEFVALAAGETLIEPINFVFSDPNAVSLPVALTYGSVNVASATCMADLDKDGDVDGRDLALKAASQDGVSPAEFSALYGILDCLIW